MTWTIYHIMHTKAYLTLMMCVIPLCLMVGSTAIPLHVLTVMRGKLLYVLSITDLNNVFILIRNLQTMFISAV